MQELDLYFKLLILAFFFTNKHQSVARECSKRPIIHSLIIHSNEQQYTLIENVFCNKGRTGYFII